MDLITPKITVLMPVYNGEKYIAEAIDSILSQTYADFELLIINDGSTDRSEAIIKQYRDQRVRLANNDQNLGLVATLNRGLELAAGQYIARMDQDDISLPSRLAEQVVFMDQHQQVGLCGTWIEVFGLGNYIEKYPTDYGTIKASLLFYNALAHPTVMMRKELFDRFHLRYSLEYLHAEDYELWQRCSNCFEVANIGKVLLRYRTSPTSYCRVFSVEQNATMRRMDERNFKLLGIEVRDEDLTLHNNIRNMLFIPSREFINQASHWLETLRTANVQTKYCSAQAFSLVLGTYWFRICRHAHGLGLWTWYRYLNSNFCRLSQRRWSDSAYLFAACCKQEIRSRLFDH